MFHASNLGKYEAIVRPFSDMDGYVPEPGDAPFDFKFDRQPWTDDEWSEFVERATRAVRVASATAARWGGADHRFLIKTAIHESGWTQARVAEAMGMTQPALSSRLNNRISLDTVSQISGIIGWSMAEILGE